jgi:hypothetical protein
VDGSELNFLICNGAGNNSRIGEQESSSGGQDASDFLKYGGAVAEMKDYVDGKSCVESGAGERERIIEVSLLEVEQVLEIHGGGACAAGSDGFCTGVCAGSQAAHLTNDEAERAAGATAEVE